MPKSTGCQPFAVCGTKVYKAPPQRILLCLVLRYLFLGRQLSFTPAVEISFIRPKHQKYIAVAIEGQESSPSLFQAQKMRELMTPSELATMPGDRCILQLRGLPPFYCKKYDLKQHLNYKYTAESDKQKNAFSLGKLIDRLRQSGLADEYEAYEATVRTRRSQRRTRTSFSMTQTSLYKAVFNPGYLHHLLENIHEFPRLLRWSLSYRLLAYKAYLCRLIPLHPQGFVGFVGS